MSSYRCAAILSQVSLIHSNSATCTPCDVRAYVQRPQADDSGNICSYEQQPQKQQPAKQQPQVQHQQQLLQGNDHPRSFRGSQAELTGRSDTPLPSLNDFPIRSYSLDIQRLPISTPGLPVSTASPKGAVSAVSVSLPRVEPSAGLLSQPHARQSSELQPHQCLESSDAPRSSPTAEPPPLPMQQPHSVTSLNSNSVLLALCPSIPAAMRRRIWCLEVGLGCLMKVSPGHGLGFRKDYDLYWFFRTHIRETAVLCRAVL